MARARAWNGPAIFSMGFRPFFFFGAVYAALMVALWVPWFLGLIDIPSAFPPVAWHAHELLFGYVSAIVAGFLLTAVPNWTGRLPVVGWPLVGLFLLWLFGRLALAFSQGLPALSVAAAVLVFPIVFAVVIGREIFIGNNRRNLIVLVVLTVFTLAQALFHYEVWRFGDVIYADRLAIATIVMLITIIGGRIVPSFTRNWLKKMNPGSLPTPLGNYDKLTMVVGGVTLVLWVTLPLLADFSRLVGAVMIVAGLLHFVRLLRWQSHRTLKEPMVTVLHVAYVFVPIGFVLGGYAAFADDFGVATGAVHAWTVGTVGLMTLAVMTRATRGHTGRPVIATPATIVIYLAIFVAVIARIAAAFLPEFTSTLMSVAGIGWVLAFLGFAISYGPMLLTKR